MKQFEPAKPMQTTCCFECAIEYSKKPKAQKAYKMENKKLLKDKYPDMSRLRKIAIIHFNKYIRLRDEDLPCISCGYVWNDASRLRDQSLRNKGQMIVDNRQAHAGHFKPAGANPQIRFNELNVHKQCSICNNHLSGNLVPYRANLIKKIGLEEVEKLESNKESKKYSADDYKNIAQKYKLKIKEIE